MDLPCTRFSLLAVLQFFARPTPHAIGEQNARFIRKAVACLVVAYDPNHLMLTVAVRGRTFEVRLRATPFEDLLVGGAVKFSGLKNLNGALSAQAAKPAPRR